MPQTVRRAIDMLFLVAESASGKSLSELASALELNKATAYRLAQTLTETELFRQDAMERRYFPGDGLFRLAGFLQQNEGLRTAALSYMEDLRDKTEETVSLVVAKGLERVTIEVLPSTQELKLVPALNSAKPIYAGAPGKALLAYLSEREIERVIKETGLRKIAAGTITSPEKLHQDLRRVHQVGYASSTEETVPGSAAVAAPIFDFRGEVIAALNVYGPRFRLKSKQLKQHGALVAEVARHISADLGASAPSPSGKNPKSASA